MRAPNRFTRRRGPGFLGGASLIEILVAMLVLSLGLLGLAAMQARALRGNISSIQQTQAVILSHYIFDLMRVDRGAAITGAYNTGGAANAAPACNAGAFNGVGLAQIHLAAWIGELKAQIGRPGDPTTCGAIWCDAQGVCTVRIQWDDSASGGLAAQTLSFTSRL